MKSIQLPETGFVQKFDLKSQVTALEARKPWAHGMTSELLVKTPDLRVLLIAMETGAKMKEHHSDGRISIHVVQGAIKVGVGEGTEELSAGQLLVIDKSVRHDVEAQESSVFLVTISWPSQQELRELPHRGYGS